LIELQGEQEVSNLIKVESLINQRNFATYNFFTEGKEYSTISDEEYKRFVREGVQHCLRGDVFQIVLSRSSCSLSRVTTSRSIVHYAPSIPRPTSSISISADTASSAHRPRPIVGLAVRVLASTPLREPQNVPAVTRKI